MCLFSFSTNMKLIFRRHYTFMTQANGKEKQSKIGRKNKIEC